MAGRVGAAGCLLLTVWAVTSSGQNVTTQVVVDFVQFYKHRDVYVLDPASGSSWAAETFLTLATRTSTFAAVLPLANPGAPRGRHKHNVDPLMVTLLPSPRHAAFLAHVFPQAPKWSSWLLLLLLSSPDPSPWLDPLTLPLDSRVTVAVLSPEGAAATLWQVYQLAPDKDKKLLAAGYWLLQTSEADEELDWVKRQIKSQDRLEERTVSFGRMLGVPGDPLLRRTDLSGLRLTCTAVQEAPYTLLKPSQRGTVTVTGIYGDIFTTLRQITNFTNVCRPSQDGQWGALKEGRWTGMIGEVVAGTADMAVAALDITPERSEAVDFLLPVFQSRYKMAVKRPTNRDQMWGTYTKQFSNSVWAALAATAVVLTLALHGTTTTLEVGKARLSLPESFIVVIGALYGQGCSTPPHSTPARLVLLTTLLLHVVVLAYYTSNLASSLATGPVLPTFSTIREVLSEPQLSFGVMRETALTEYLKSSDNPYHQAAYGLVTADQSLMVGTSAEGMAKTLQENYVYMDTDSYIYYNADCRHYVLPGSEFRAFTSIAFQKGSPLVRILNGVLLRMKTGGLLRKMEAQWLPRVENCGQTSISPLHLGALVTPFLGLLFALVLSLSCCWLERIIKARKHRSIASITFSGPRDIALSTTVTLESVRDRNTLPGTKA